MDLAGDPRYRASGILWMTVGSAIVFVSVALMNKFAEATIERNESRPVAFQVKAPPPPPPPAEMKPPPPPRPRSAPPPAAPLAGLGSAISGIDLGLPAFNFDELDNLDDSLLGADRDVVMTDDLVDVAPKPARQAPMAYPASAKSRGLTGYVVLNLLIDGEGRVEKVKVLESIPAGVFDQSAVNGVRKWRFEPATYQGKNVRVWARQKIRFDLS